MSKTMRYCELDEAFEHVRSSADEVVLAEDDLMKIVGVPLENGNVNLIVKDDDGKIDEIEVSDADECEAELDGFIDYYLDYLDQELVTDIDDIPEWKSLLDDDDEDPEEYENEYNYVFNDLKSLCYGSDSSIDSEEFKETIIAFIASRFGRDVVRPMVLGGDTVHYPYLDTRFWSICESEFAV